MTRHVVRDAPECSRFGPGGVDAGRGAALTEWVGFTLRPRNLFDGTPLYTRPEAAKKDALP